MALTLQQMYIDKARRVNAPEDNERFMFSFMSALTEVLASLERSAHVTPTYTASPEADVGLDQRYIPVISAGLDCLLEERSEWKVDDPRTLRNIWETELARAPSIYFADNAPDGRTGDLS